MIFEVENKILASAIEKVFSVVKEKSCIEMLKYIHLELMDNILTITVNNQELLVKKKIEVAILEEGSICVNARKMKDITSILGEGYLRFEADDKNTISIKATNSEFNLAGSNGDDFLHQDIKKMKISEVIMSLTADDILKLSKTKNFCSDDQFKMRMNGVSIKSNSTNKITICGCDGWSIYLVPLEKQVNLTKIGVLDIILTIESLNLLLALKEDFDFKLLQIKQEKGFKIIGIIAENNNSFLRLSIIDEVFPPYDNVLPKDLPNSISVDKSEFINAIKKSAICMNEVSKLIDFYITPNEIRISGNDNDTKREAISILNCEADIYKNTSLVYVKLLTILGALTTERIKIETDNAANKGLIFKNIPDDDCVALLMPHNRAKIPTITKEESDRMLEEFKQKKDKKNGYFTKKCR